MARQLFFLTFLISIGCSGQEANLARYVVTFDEADDGIALTKEFSKSLQLLVEKDGKAIPKPAPEISEPPPALAPEGWIIIDGKRFAFYPGWLQRGELSWHDNNTKQFFRAMYPIDGSPGIEPEEFIPYQTTR